MKDYYPNMGLSELLCENFVVQFQNKVLRSKSAWSKPKAPPLADQVRWLGHCFSQGNPYCEKRTGASIKIMAIDIQQEEKIEGQKKRLFKKKQVSYL